MRAVGIDVWEGTGEIGWDDLQVDFVYRRVSDGALVDKGWPFQPHPVPENRRYLMGGYAAFYPWVPAAAQAATLVAHYNDHGEMELPPAIDCEKARYEGPVVYRQVLDEMVDRVEDGLQRRTIIYTRKDWWERYATPWPRHYPGPLVGRDLWLARATSYLPRDACPSGWLTWAIWQKLFTAVLPGCKVYVDLNEFDGTLEDMRAWALTQRHV